MPTNPFSDGLSVKINSDTEDFTSGIDGAIGKLGDFRTQVGLAGAAIATLGSAGIAGATSEAADFESQMADVQKVTDEETAAELEGRLQDLSTEIPIATGELVTLAEQAGKFGAEGPDEIEKFVESVGQIQTATDLAAEEAGTRFAKIAGALDMPLSEVGKLGNATNKLADSMKTDAGEITDTATRAANTLGQQLGLGEDAVLSLSASMNEVSPSSRRAASSLRRAAESLMDPKKAEDIAGALGMSTEEFRTMREEEPEALMERVAEAMAENDDTATELRGVLGKAANDFSKLGEQLDTTEEAQQRVNEQFEEGTSLEREMSIRTDTFHGQMRLLKNQIGNVARTTGEVFLPYLTDLLGTVGDAVEGFQDFNEEMDGLPGALGLAAIAIGGIGVALASFAGGPITIAIGAVAALATAFATDFAGIRTVTMEVLDFVGDWTQRTLERVRDLWDEWGPRLVSAAESLWDLVTDAVDTAVEELQDLVDVLLGHWETIWDEHGDRIISTAERIWGLIQDVVDAAVEFYQTQIEDIIDIVQRLWSEHGDELMTEVGETWAHIRSEITDYWEWARPYFSTAIDALLTIVNTGLDAIQSFWDEWGDEIMFIVDFVVSTVKGAFETGLDALLTIIKIGLNLIQGDWEEAWDEIVGFAERTLDGLVEFAEEWGPRLVDFVVGALQDIVDAVLEWALPDEIKSVLDDVIGWFEWLYNQLIGDSLIPDLLSDIKGAVTDWDIAGAFSAAFGAVEGAINTALDFAPDISQITGAIDDIFSAAGDALDELERLTNFDIDIDWPEPPDRVQDWMSGNFDIDWPSMPDGGDDDDDDSDGDDDSDSDDDNRSYSPPGVDPGSDTGDDGDDDDNGDGVPPTTGVGDDDNPVGGGGGGGVSSGSSSPRGSFAAFQGGGLTRDAGFGLLHPNEAVMGVKAGAAALVDEMRRQGGGPTTVSVTVEEVHAEDGADFGRRLERELQSRGWTE